MLKRVGIGAWLGFMVLNLWGCAQMSPHPQDPLESFNRVSFKLNQAVDSAVIKPAAYVYLKYIPLAIQSGIGNFFDNLREIPTVINDLLQVKFAYATHDTSRFLINTTLGIGGIFDPASRLGLQRHRQDLGQTFYQWGYQKSTYLVLPLLGPSTIRDTVGFGIDYYVFSIWPWVKDDKLSLLSLDYFDKRSRILRKGSVLDTLAVDKYVFMRDAYFQNRQYSFNESSGNETDVVDPYENSADSPKPDNAEKPN